MTLDAIDSIRLQINSNEKMRVASSGNEHAATNPTAALHVPGSTAARALRCECPMVSRRQRRTMAIFGLSAGICMPGSAG